MPHKNELNECDEENGVELDIEEQQNLEIKPSITFGVLTDIQYADVEDGTSYDKKRIRYYRNSLNLVKEAIKNWKKYEQDSKQNLKFVIQLGDLIDGKCKSVNESLPSMQRVLTELNSIFENKLVDELGLPRLLHIFGNHEMYNFLRSDLVNLELNTARFLKQNLNTNANYYTYNVNEKLKLICLDFYEFSVIGYEESSEEYKQAFDFLTKHNKNKDLNSTEGLRGHAQRFSKFNGALSQNQMSWFENELRNCNENKIKAIVCGHLPVHAKASDPTCLAWNSKEVLEVLWRYNRTVIAYFAGHDHQGGYFRDKQNIHHITFSAILETPSNSNAYATVKVYENKVSVEGVGVIGYYEIYFD